jgi:hypothetical protein
VQTHPKIATMSNETPTVGSQVDANQTPQTPQVGTQQTLDAPQAGDSTQPSTLTLEQALDALKKARAEAASYRVKLNDYERQQQEAERAKLTKEEQLSAKIADYERDLAEKTRQHQERMVRYEVRLHAAKLGIIDPEAAEKLLDLSQLEYDGDGTPKNMQKLLQDLVKAKPYLAATPSSGSAANPPRTQSLTFTQSQIAQMSPDEYKQNKAAIWAAQREGRILPG